MGQTEVLTVLSSRGMMHICHKERQAKLGDGERMITEYRRITVHVQQQNAVAMGDIRNCIFQDI